MDFENLVLRNNAICCNCFGRRRDPDGFRDPRDTSIEYAQTRAMSDSRKLACECGGLAHNERLYDTLEHTPPERYERWVIRLIRSLRIEGVDLVANGALTRTHDGLDEGAVAFATEALRWYARHADDPQADPIDGLELAFDNTARPTTEATF